jgi:nicotinate-nucleotide adenylyltransferase
LQNLPRWKNGEQIMRDHDLYVYVRSGHPIAQESGTRVKILQAPLLDISATAIRNNIRNGNSIRYLVPEKVRDEIERNRYYK